MATRQRRIRPDIMVQDGFMELSVEARLIYLSLPCFADCAGNVPASAKGIKARLFAADDFTATAIQGWLNELVAVGYLIPYSHDGVAYFHFANWSWLQDPKNPTTEYPAYPAQVGKNTPKNAPDDHSPTNGVTLPESEGDRIGENRIEERIGGEGITHTPPQDISKKIENWEDACAVLQDWSKQNVERVKGWIQKMHYDVSVYGPAYHQIPRFCARYAGDELYADPVGFFESKFPTWLSNAKKFDKPGQEAKQEQAPSYKSPESKQEVGYGRGAAAAWIEKNLPGYQPSKSDLHFFAICKSEQEMWDLANKIPRALSPGVQVLSDSPPKTDTARRAQVVDIGSVVAHMAVAK